MELPLKKSFIPEQEKRTVPRQPKSLFERNSIGKKYLGEVYETNEMKFKNKPRNLKRFETLIAIRESSEKENKIKMHEYEKLKEHNNKYNIIMRNVLKQVFENLKNNF